MLRYIKTLVFSKPLYSLGSLVDLVTAYPLSVNF